MKELSKEIIRHFGIGILEAGAYLLLTTSGVAFGILLAYGVITTAQ